MRQMKRLQDAFNQRLEPLELETSELFKAFFETYPNMPEMRIVNVLTFFSFIIDSYTDVQLLNPSDEETIAIHDDIFNLFKEEIKDTKSDDEIRGMADHSIAAGLPDFIIFLSSYPHATRRLCQLIHDTRLLSINKGFVQNHQHNDIHDTHK